MITFWVVVVCLQILIAGKTQQVRSSNDPPIFHMECEAINDGHDQQHHFVCVQQKDKWIFKHLDFNYMQSTDQVMMSISQDADAEYKAKLSQNAGSLWLIQAELFQSQFVFHYVGVSHDPTTGVFSFPHTEVPDSIKNVQQNIERAVKSHILQKVPQKSHLLRNAIIIAIILVMVVLGLNYWKGQQMRAQIEEPKDLKEQMIAKMDIQEEQNRKNSSGVIRSSEPPKKKMNF